MTAMESLDQPKVFDRPQPVKLTVDHFLLLAEAGAFEQLAKKVELLDGVITVMSPQLNKHMLVKSQLAFRLQNRLLEIGSPLMIFVDGTLTARPSNAPEPDIFITANPHGEGYASVGDAPLVIEVAHTTLRHDLGRKKKIYAIAGVPEYWVFDIPGATIHQFWHPHRGAYAETRRISVPGPVASATLPGLEVQTHGLI